MGTGANPKPNTLVELRVTGEPGTQVAILGEDVDATTAGLSNKYGLGSGLDMNKVGNSSINLSNDYPLLSNNQIITS